MTFYVGSGDLKYRLNDCWADALSAEPSPQPAPMKIFLCIKSKNVNIYYKRERTKEKKQKVENHGGKKKGKQRKLCNNEKCVQKLMTVGG